MTKTPRAVLVIFCLLLLAPLMGQWCRLDPFYHSENRTLATRPSLELALPVLQKFPREYQAYFNDNFGFRHALVRGNHILRYGLLGGSSSPRVIIGKKGWLYYTGDGEVNDFRGITSYNDDQLRRWTYGLRLKRDWLKSRGIRYLYVIAPNKSTIYPEYLPPQYGRIRQKSGLDDFMAYIRKYPDLKVVDLRRPLIQNKEKHTLYFQTDTHWNNYGAFIGYTEMICPIKEWFPAVNPLTLNDFEIKITKKRPGDLADMMGGHDFLFDEDYVFIPKQPFNAVSIGQTKNIHDPFTTQTKDKALPRALIFRDSFFSSMVPFVAENFSVSHFVWTRWNSDTPVEELIEQYKPDVVIEEVVERLTKQDAENFCARVPDYLIPGTYNKTITVGKGF